MSSNKRTLKNICTFIISLVLGGYLLWVVLEPLRSGEAKVAHIFEQCLSIIHYFILAYIVMIAGLLVRAHRWQVMLGMNGVVWAAYRSIALGYLINLILSRVGEVVRLMNFHKYTKASVGSLASTVFIDRLLDVFILNIMLIYAIVYESQILEDHFPEFTDLLPKFAVLLVIALLGMALLLVFGDRISKMILKLNFLPEKVRQFSSTFVIKFSDGFKVVNTLPKISYMIFATFLIWILYFLSFYFLIFNFPGFDETLNLRQCFFLFLCVTIGMTIPTPGGIGSYHYFMKVGMVTMASISEIRAVEIVTVLYLIQIQLITILFGLPAYIYQLLFDKHLLKDIPEKGSELDGMTKA